jgi:protein subunit release factor B
MGGGGGDDVNTNTDIFLIFHMRRKARWVRQNRFQLNKSSSERILLDSDILGKFIGTHTEVKRFVMVNLVNLTRLRRA